jgi:hypothetical protein
MTLEIPPIVEAAKDVVVAVGNKLDNAKVSPSWCPGIWRQ